MLDLKVAQGIEVGHVFKLGELYAEKLGATYLDEQGKQQTMRMGCYGIGVSRTLAAVVEQFHDDKGIKWPHPVTPFHVHLVAINPKNDDQAELSEKLYHQLKDLGYEVLYDDRAERPGVKFADSELIGLPLRITVGKRAPEGIVECKVRDNGEQTELHISELADYLKQFFG